MTGNSGSFLGVLRVAREGNIELRGGGTSIDLLSSIAELLPDSMISDPLSGRDRHAAEDSGASTFTSAGAKAATTSTTGTALDISESVAASGITVARPGPGRDNLINGTSGNDTLTGTTRADTINGLDGSDTINGLGGNDTIDGGLGDDTIYGGEGDDTIYGGAGGFFGDRIYDGAGNDRVYGGVDQDMIYASAGNDYYDGGTGETTGFDLDVVSYANASAGIVVDMNLSSGEVRSSGIGDAAKIGVDTIVNFETIEGSAFDDVMTGSGAIFNGGAGNDVLTVGAGGGAFDGGDGNDVLDGTAGVALASYGSSAVGVNVSLAITGSQDTGQGLDTLTSIEQLWGSNFDDTLVGDDNSNEIEGLQGNDVLSGGGGADFLTDHMGNDALSGGDGNDLLDAGTGSDVLDGGTGDDILYCGEGNDENDTILFRAGDGKDSVSEFGSGDSLIIQDYSSALSVSQVGNDVVVMLSSSDQITVKFSSVAAVEAAIQFMGAPATEGDDVLTGGPGDDTINGLGGNDTIAGAAGNDTLSGGSGGDTLNGGDGDDTLYSVGEPEWTGNPLDRNGGTEVDTLNGGTGDDLIYAGYGDHVDGGADGYSGDMLFVTFQGATSGITFDLHFETQMIGGATITGIERIGWIEGTDFDDYVNIESASDDPWNYDTAQVFGMGGDDTLIGGSNTWVLHGGDGDDVLDGRAAVDPQNLIGDAGNDIIYASISNRSTTDGGEGDDTIYSFGWTYGGDGNDTIILQGSPDYATGYVGTQGDAGDDHITGSAEADGISGGSGADWIDGGDGDDYLFSYDVQNGTAWSHGPSSLDSGTERDTLIGGAGDDHLAAGYGDDVDGGDGTDTLRLNLAGATSGVVLSAASLVSGQPMVIGGGTIQNIEQLEYLRGTDFADTLTVGDQSPITIDGGGGNDILNSSGNNVHLAGGDGDDVITATGTASIAWGGNGNDVIALGASGGSASGDDGDDRFISIASGNLFYGGDGVDVIDYSNATGSVTVDLDANGTSDDKLIGIEDVRGTGLADSITGDFAANRLWGEAGNDLIDGEYGDDLIEGGAGNDTIIGGYGDDTLTGGDGNDIFAFKADDGKDIITDLAADDRVQIDGYSSAQSITQVGVNVVVIFSSADQITFFNTSVATVQSALEILAPPAISGTPGSDTLTGTAAADTIFGLAGNDILNGLAGNDILDGGTGNDSMKGGAGDDIYHVDSASDVVTEMANAGLDEVRTTVTYTLRSNVENARAEGAAAINLTGNTLANSLTGNSAANTLNGGGGDDVLDGGGGADNLLGGAGNDIYYVDNVGDKVTEALNGGADEVRSSLNYALAERMQVEKLTADGTAAVNLTGNEFAQTLQGNDAANSLNGGGGIDTLFGGGGGDALNGGAGNDILWGGEGGDHFIFQGTSSQVGKDNIMDFQSGVDKIDLDAFGIGMAQVESVASAGNTILQIDANMDGVSDFTIILTGVSGLEASDFIF